MAFLLGGLQGVSMDQIEAARIDGANNWQVFTHIVAPAMRGIMTLVLILGTIWALLLAIFSFVYLRQVNESD